MRTFESPSQCVAFGWPWHGPIKRGLDGVYSVWQVHLPTGRKVKVLGHAGGDTLRFDIGCPDVVSEAVAAEGGAWWGRAILRYSAAAFEDLSGYQVATYGAGVVYPYNGFPLYRAPVDEEPGVVFFVNVLVRLGMLSITARYQGRTISATRPLTAAELGQGSGQPEFAADNRSFGDSDPVCRMISDAEPGRYFSALLDVKDSTVLLGIIGYTSASNTVIANRPLGTQKNGPGDYAALVEVELTAPFFEVDADPLLGVVVRLLDDRRAATGDPTLTLTNETVGALQTRTETWTQSAFLVTAWYSADGAVVRAQCDRTQESKRTHEIRGLSGEIEEVIAARKTTVTMRRAGIAFDAVELYENIQVTQTNGASLRVIRTIKQTDEPDDVADSGELVTTNISWPDPLPVFGPGVHRVATVVAYEYGANWGGGSILPYQDLRAVWVCALSNKLAGICTAQEPYAYADGAGSYLTQCHYRPAAHPIGIDGRNLRTTEVHPIEGITRWYRSFYYFGAGATGSYNPVTSEVLRGSAINRESWV